MKINIIKKLEQKKSVILKVKISSDLTTPVLTFLKLKKYFPKNNFLYESVEKGKNRARFSIIGLKPDLMWKIKDKIAYFNENFEENSENFIKITEKPLENLRKLINSCKINDIKSDLPVESGLFGYMSYDMVKLMENIGDHRQDDEINIPDSIFIRPQILVIFDSLFDVIYITAPIFPQENRNPEDSYKHAQSNIKEVTDIINSSFSGSEVNLGDKKIEFKNHLSEEKYKNMVQKAKDYITSGDALQILISQRFSAKFNQENSFDFYRSLRSINPSPFMFFVNFDDFNIIGSSPEILSSLKNGKVTIRPLAGTRKRGRDEFEDKKNAKDLLSDKKEIAEHLMLIDLGRNDVARVCKKQSVKVTEKMIIEYYSHVMHISSNVEGEILDNKDGLDVLTSSFPAGTVSGAPKIRAMQIIEEIEEEKRGFYAGSVGYFSANGDMEHCICLRTSLIKNNTIYLQAGAGIVYDSVPESEYQECLNKAAALMKSIKINDNIL
tara:strand:- start:19269 stop:20753 length:1485 start_codon:yes stop_codon:yes gene_type:complete